MPRFQANQSAIDKAAESVAATHGRDFVYGYSLRHPPAEFPFPDLHIFDRVKDGKYAICQGDKAMPHLGSISAKK